MVSQGTLRLLLILSNRLSNAQKEEQHAGDETPVSFPLSTSTVELCHLTLGPIRDIIKQL